MTSPDIHVLTGAYVLDAVSEHERAAFERHLAECGPCAQEVAELRGTAARLGMAAATEPPAELKARVLARIAEVRQIPPDRAGGPVRRPGVSPWALRLTAAAAAVLLVVGIALGVLLVRERQALDDSRAQAAALSAILQAGDAQVASGTPASGGTATVVASRSQNRMLLLADGLAQLPSGSTYQAWLIGSGGAQSAGLLSGQDTRLDVTGIGGATSVGLSVEPAGGSPTPTTDKIVALLSLPV